MGDVFSSKWKIAKDLLFIHWYSCRNNNSTTSTSLSPGRGAWLRDLEARWKRGEMAITDRHIHTMNCVCNLN